MDNNELINLYFDGLLNDAEKFSFERKIKEDQIFAEEYYKYKKDIEIFKELPQYSPSPNFTDSLVKKLNLPKNKKDNVFFLSVVISLIITFVFIAVSVFGYVNKKQLAVSEYKNSLFDKINLESLNSVLHSNNFLIILSSVTLIMLIVVYFIQSNFNKLKKQLA